MSALITGTVGGLGQLGDRLVGAGADRDRGHVAGEDARGVGDRLAAGELQLVAAQDDRRAAELGDPDLEGDPGPGRGLLEDERDRAAGQRRRALARADPPSARPPARRSRRARSADSSSPVRKCARHGKRSMVALRRAACALPSARSRILRLDGASRAELEPLPRPRPLRRTRAAHLALPAAAQHRAGHDPRAGQLRPVRAVRRRCSATAEWDIALLQECPPRWAEALATACRGRAPPGAHRAQPAAAADRCCRRCSPRLNPDLIASWEGGCNLTLVRGERSSWPAISERSELTLTRRPETRRMAFSRLRFGLCIANLHASEAPSAAVVELRARPRRVAVELGRRSAADPRRRPQPAAGDQRRAVRARCSAELGLSAAAVERSSTTCCARGLEVAEAPQPLAGRAREVPDPTAPSPRDGAADPALRPCAGRGRVRAGLTAGGAHGRKRPALCRDRG